MMVAVRHSPATGGKSAVWNTVGGSLAVGTGYSADYLALDLAPANTAGMVVTTTITLPPDARIESAVFEISADAMASAELGSFAQVSPTTPTGKMGIPFWAAASIDFGAMVTVGGLSLTSSAAHSLSVNDVRRWNGIGWQFVADGLSFADIATQRLLVQSKNEDQTSANLASGLASARIALPVVPAGLELAVNGRTVWFERQGSSAIPDSLHLDPAPSPSPGASTYLVERSDALRDALAAAVAAAAADATEVSIPVSLRATTPGALTLTPHVSALRVYPVTFVPEGPSHSFDLAEEGLISVLVTPPGALTVHEVALTARGRFGPERVTPAVGPEITQTARLALAAGRTILLGLPRVLLGRLSALTGVRLRLQLPEGGSGGQVTGRLLAAGSPGRPGDPLPGSDLVALDVTRPEASWYTLAFAEQVSVPAPEQPLPTDDGVGAWLELQPSYGEVECLLTTTPVADTAGPGAPLRRRLAGGATTELTTITGIGVLLAAVRLVGMPDQDAPLPAATFRVAGTSDVLGVTPDGDGVGVVLTLPSPVDATTPVTLEITCAGPGSLTLQEVRVTYQPEVPS